MNCACGNSLPATRPDRVGPVLRTHYETTRHRQWRRAFYGPSALGPDAYEGRTDLHWPDPEAHCAEPRGTADD